MRTRYIVLTAAATLAAAAWLLTTHQSAPRVITPVAQPAPDTAPSTIAVPMCPATEPGEPMHLIGRVFDEHNKPLTKASVIAYSTDDTGLYVPRGSSTRTPRINAVAVTDANGWFHFTTIKPGPYPDTDDPIHIHLHVDAAVHKHMYRTLWFEDDPRLTPAKRRAIDTETRIVPLIKRDDGTLEARCDIRLEGA